MTTNVNPIRVLALIALAICFTVACDNNSGTDDSENTAKGGTDSNADPNDRAVSDTDSNGATGSDSDRGGGDKEYNTDVEPIREEPAIDEGDTDTDEVDTDDQDTATNKEPDTGGDDTDDKDTATSKEPDAGKEPPPEPECDEKGAKTKEPCSSEDLCNCENICGSAIIEVANEKAGEIPAHFCYAKCDPDNPNCPGASECYEIPKRWPICVEKGIFKANKWQMKIYQGVSPNLETPNIENLEIEAKMGDIELPAENINWGKQGGKGNVTLSFFLYKQYEENQKTMVNSWLLTVIIPKDLWKVGTIEFKPAKKKSQLLDSFQAVLTHSVYPVAGLADGGLSVSRMWTEGMGLSGKLTITKIVAPCTDLEECQDAAEGSVDIEILGTRYEIVKEMFEKN